MCKFLKILKMNKQIVLVFLFFSSFAFSQKNWFKAYTDKDALAKDGVEVGNQFIADAKKIIPNLKNEPQIIVNTTPFLIYYDGEKNTVNLPLWSEVIPDSQQYFEKITGNTKDGKKLYGLMFNGFYLPHELGHWLTVKKSGNLGSYQDEYFANTVAMLWWKKQGKSKELKSIYKTLKKVMKTYPNPVPKGENAEKYYTENYVKIMQDQENFAMIYGFMQFSQFIKIYEDRSLPDFDKFLQKEFKK